MEMIIRMKVIIIALSVILGVVVSSAAGYFLVKHFSKDNILDVTE